MNKESSSTLVKILLILTLLLQPSFISAAGGIEFNQSNGDEDPPIGEGTPPNTIYLPSISSISSVGQDTLGPEVQSVASAILGAEEEIPVTEKPQGSANGTTDEWAAPAPGLEPSLIDDAAGKTAIEDESLAPAAVDGWTTIMSQSFEGAFPSSGWRVLDANGTTNGEYYWDDVSYKAQTGSWSAWAARGGTNGLNPASYNYPNNMRSWMIYGPFSLSDATDATLSFGYWNQSELGYDYFKWLASTDGTNFYGYQTAGNSNGWQNVNFDLKSVPTLGNLTGKSSVWIAFYFISDGSITAKGPFVDNVLLRKNVTSVSCSNQYKAEYFNNRTLSGSPVVTRCENWPINYNWGSGSPVSGVGSDNFSVRWTGTASINAGNYTFVAAADDGIRVWLDNSLIIDAWRDQAPTAYRTNRTVSSGNHSIKVEYYEYGGGAVAQFSWAPAVTNGVPGITYGIRNDFKTFKVDLWSSNLSFETVMGLDASSGNTTKVEYVREMVVRSPYAGRNPVLAINADYFGQGHHGAEGLTVKNGVRLPNAGTNNGEEWRRSSLSISRSKSVRIGKQTDCVGSASNPTACASWVPDANNYYNTVGGGPLFIQNGRRIGGTGSTSPCTAESLSSGYCTNSFNWTAAGISGDGRYLIIIVSDTGKTMDQAAAVLIAEGASIAIKLDGGGSSQVWYKPTGNLISGSRRVTNALMIFSSQ